MHWLYDLQIYVEQTPSDGIIDTTTYHWQTITRIKSLEFKKITEVPDKSHIKNATYFEAFLSQAYLFGNTSSAQRQLTCLNAAFRSPLDNSEVQKLKKALDATE